MAREELKKFRMSKKMTQEDMAQTLRISVSHYKGIERGIQDPSFKLLCQFYEVFKNEYNDIWTLFARS